MSAPISNPPKQRLIVRKFLLLTRKVFSVNLIEKGHFVGKIFQEFTDPRTRVRITFTAVVQSPFFAALNEGTIYAHLPCSTGFTAAAD
ncbi:hypothetical protein IX53_04415 [Kosmotoga pacifica]|uniref:Uncharacterized protein n=1 Tax=Kosmotoga pacifica TaxID=1330330 RepID=A0A0G2ZEC2_9BACT|nr:hypothetical protein IX53_04415 [Kosmotoga pacifica]